MTGNYVLVVFQNGNAGDHVWIKDVQITDLTEGADYVGEIRTIGDFAFTAIGLTTELAAGTEVSVTMKVDAASTSDAGALLFVNSLYADNTPNEVGDIGDLKVTAGGWDTNGYKEVTFTAKVVNFAEVDFNQNGTIAGDFKMTGNYVLIVLQNGKAGDHVWIKDVVITAAAA